MQLVVEVSEDTFFDLKKKQNRTEVDNAVLNGTPLDKIRAEIEEQKECRCFDDDDMCIYRAGLDDALDIIDKYKAESEGSDANSN